MSELQRGKLKVTRKGKRDIIQVAIDDNLFNIAQGQLSAGLTATDGLEVEFIRVAGQPREIRAVGQQFRRPGHPQASTGGQQSGQQSQRGGRGGRRRPDHHGRKQGGQPARSESSVNQKTSTPDFHNPYNFIPAPPRKIGHTELGDHDAVSQDCFHLDRYTGRICVELIAKTPLLVPETDPDHVHANSNGHKTFELRTDADGLPVIPVSGIRGMLRSAYEAVSNSRFGRFSREHQTRLQYRESRRPFRKLPYPTSAWDLLHESLRPATSVTELSPADRVFGWVRTDTDNRETRQRDETVARRGLLRVGPVICESKREDAVDEFERPGVPLAILATPKPQQGRFYVAESENGEAQPDGRSKIDAGYGRDKGLRGRKVYPHQSSLPENHWERPEEDRTQQSGHRHYQEYRRPKSAEVRDDQNRSILGWVKPGARFSFDIHVQNLSLVELGALLWLLSLPEDHFFRFGGGKPLGFGSVRLSIRDCDVCAGAELRKRYLTWSAPPPATDCTRTAVDAFKQALVDAYSEQHAGNREFERVRFIAAFLAACRGFGDNLPIHYPRATANGQHGPPNPQGESFKWFVANEDQRNRYALRDLAAHDPETDERVIEPGLPTLREKQSGGRGSRGRRDGRDRGRRRR